MIITLGFLLNATKNPPTIYGGFTNNGMPENTANPQVVVSLGTNGKYRIFVDDKEFASGSYESSGDNTCVFKPQEGTDGVMVLLTKKKFYLYYTAIKKKLMIISKMDSEPSIEPFKIGK